MTKNLTLRLDSDTLRRCRRAAGQVNKSISRWVEDLITTSITRENGFEDARKTALLYLNRGFNLGGKPLRREEAHAR
jgi:hypothetical protein